MTFTQRIAGAALGALLLGSGLLASPAQAGYVITVEQLGDNVVATGSGAIDLTDLDFFMNTDRGPGFIDPLIACILTGDSLIDIYTGFSGPTSFGSSGETLATSNNGSGVGINGGQNLLAVPPGYISDTVLSASSTFANQTFSSLGVTPGTYEWTWGTGENQNFTVLIGAAAVPEPASAALLGGALGGLLLAGSIRRYRSEV
jgi:hypothetical protein